MNEKLLEQLAAKLGTTTEYLWHVLVQGQAVVGMTDLSEGVIFTIAVAICISGMRHAFATFKAGDDDDLTIALMLFSGAGIIVSMILMMICFEGGLLRLMRPEYAALKDIIKILTPDK